MPRGGIRPECSIEDCLRPHHGRGWCRMHYKLWRRNGDPERRQRLINGAYEICTNADCDRSHYCKGLCESHYRYQRIQRDPNLRLKANLRTRLYIAARNGQKAGSAVNDLGCSIKAFKLYIENQFTKGMSWDNHGKWHLDHVLPLASFDLTNRMEFLEAVNWLNYQPLWARENLSKGASL